MIAERRRSPTVLWRCTRCGRWSHAQRRPRHHVRYLIDEHPDVNALPEEMIVDSFPSGMEYDTGAIIYSLKVHCGPFEGWMAERTE